MKNNHRNFMQSWMKKKKFTRLTIKKISEQRAFTLIEMMIVLLVISVLLIITIPNITKHNSTINTKGCQAFVKMIEAQIQAFEMDNQRLPANITELQTEKYLTSEQKTCPNGDEVEIGADGEVKVIGGEPSETTP